MSERPDDPDARQRRLDALRSLAHDDAGQPAIAPAGATPQQPPTPAPAEQLRQRVATNPRRRPVAVRALWRRWRAPALVIVAAVVIFGVVIGAIVQNNGLRLGPKPPPALVGSVIALSKAGSLSCPSAPVWSPDGKQLAVVGVVGAPPSDCPAYNVVTNLQPTSGETTTNGPPPDTFAIAIFDAASGRAVRTITLPALTQSVLCLPRDACGSGFVSPFFPPAVQSLAWSPDGRSIAAFVTYIYFDTAQIYKNPENRGLLIVAPVNGGGAARALIATGRIPRDIPGSPNLQPADFYSLPRFTWDLTTDSSTYTDIQRSQGIATVPLVAGYRLGTNGALTMDQQAQPGDVSPWRAGALDVYSSQDPAHPTAVYRSSQWLWSPDSRYAAPNINLEASITIAGVTATPPPDNTGFLPQPIIAPPDAATTAAINAAISASSNAGLARNPDGKLLAALLCAPSGAGQLTIRQVKNGQMVAQADHSYPLSSASQGCAGALSPIAWSPDGARIATSDGPDDQIIVWQVNLRG